ncbi:hypothetical protein AB0D67_27305 [Streptosporangium sp. NPDC048047]|uniref:hypothetical protein n=1 Tax=Streptosporangium sp. NPDC048047 TaxID=3155748 RepID=UPI003422C905
MTRLHDVLAEIADEVPAMDLADRAITRHRRRRRITVALTATATVTVALLGVGVGTSLSPLPRFRESPIIAASQAEPYWWEIKSVPLPDRGVAQVRYAYLGSCAGGAATPDCKGGWRVVTQDGRTYDVVQANGDSAVDTGPLAITPDGRTMAYYNRQKQAFEVRDLKSGKVLTAPLKVLPGQLRGDVFLRLSGNGRYLAFAAFTGRNEPGALVDMRNGRVTTLPSDWMPVSVGDDGTVPVANWWDMSSWIRLVSPAGRGRRVTIPEYGQNFSPLAPDGHTMAMVGKATGSGPSWKDSTLLPFNAVTGEIGNRVTVRGLPEGTGASKLGAWLNDAEVTALVRRVDGVGGRLGAKSPEVLYAVDIRTGRARPLATYRPPGLTAALFLPGVVY